MEVDYDSQRKWAQIMNLCRRCQLANSLHTDNTNADKSRERNKTSERKRERDMNDANLH